MKIATKMMLGFTAGMIAVLSIQAALTYWRETQLIEADRKQEAEQLARVVSVAVASEWDRAGRASAMRLIDYVDSHDDSIELRWREPAPDLAAGEIAHRTAGDELYSNVRVDTSTGPSGELTVVQDLSEDRRRARGVFWQIGLAILGVLAVSAIVASALGRRWVSAPLDQLLAMARNVGRGDLESRVELPPVAAGEFDELGVALNQMAADLGEGRARRLEAEARLRHAEKLATVGELAAGVAHEIGTPLNVIRGHAMTIVRGQIEAGEVVSAAETMVAHVDRIASIVRQLLGFARRSRPNRTPTDLLAMCTECLELVEPTAAERGVDLDLECPPDCPRVSVDASQLTQVITNLALNGIHACEPGGAVSIAIEPVDEESEPGGGVRIRVSDNGVGIPPDELSRIFEPFFTTKEVNEGTGLGLSIVHGIVADHGGRVDVDSEVGRGTTFVVYIPAEPDERDDPGR